jgi:UDP-N-acetylglucosamine transferase subunit ALG13
MTELEPARVMVAVGTDHHPFDRLVGWVDRWAEAHPEHRCAMQRGTSTAPTSCRSEPYFGYAELQSAMTAASVVVSHGGPATIMDARAVGRLPVVVPRRSDLGEHVDDHQVRFTRWIASRHQIVLAENEAALHRLLDLAMAEPGRFRLDGRDPTVDAAVRRFGYLVDGLLGQ